METTNDKNTDDRFSVHEFSKPWTVNEIKRNSIRIEGYTVKVYSGKHMYTGIKVEQKPVEACWDGNDVKITFNNGEILRVSEDGCWDEPYVNGKLVIAYDNLFIYRNPTDFLTIHAGRKISEAYWQVYGRRHSIHIILMSGEGRFYSCPTIYESVVDFWQWSDEIKEIFG